jgi:transglutaminase-like putative cysteine protease
MPARRKLGLRCEGIQQHVQARACRRPFQRSLWSAGLAVLGLLLPSLRAEEPQGPQLPGFSLGEPAAWVDPAGFLPAQAQPPEERGLVNDGVRNLLVDNQVFLGPTNTQYRHFVRQFITEAGVNQQSTVKVQYDPAYQRLEFHRLGLWRDGVWMDRLRMDTFRSLQRELSLEWRMLDGRTTVVAVLEDVRVGDTLEMAYTVVGDNPVFGGRFVDAFLVGWWVPVDRQRLRVLMPPERSLRWWAHAGAPAPAERETGGRRELLWDLRDQTPIRAEGQTPAWHRAFPEIGFAEFETWAEVAAWAVGLYPDAPLPDDLAPMLDDWRRLDTDDARIEAALDFVQNEIRYFGLELGTGSHRANPPDQVLLRRFGDCKDKAALLCALLRALGLEARPALVHTVLLHTLKDEPPSPLAFNHVIVCVRRGDGVLWVDPTSSHQRGRIEHRYLPPYGYALVVAPDSRDLTAIERPAPEGPGVELRERFESLSFDEAATLTVVTRFSGREAEEMRARMADTTPQIIENEYLNYYARRYPGIALAGDLEVADDPGHNVLTVTEHYRIERFWEPVAPPDATPVTCSFHAQEINARVLKPATVLRTMPLQVPYPVHLRQIIEARLPDEWEISPETVEISSPHMRYASEVTYTNGLLTLEYRFETLADAVPAEAAAEHIEKLQRIQDDLSFTLTHTPTNGETPFALNWSLLGTSTMLAILMMGIAVVLLRHRSPTSQGPPPLPSAGPRGLGGWLVLVTIGLILRVPARLMQLVESRHNFNLHHWRALTEPGAESFHPLWAPGIQFSVHTIMVLLIWTLLLIALFFMRRRLFPKLMIGMLAAEAVEAAIEAAFAQHLPTYSPAEMQSAVLTLVMRLVILFLWGAYLLVSRRVRNTFRR